MKRRTTGYCFVMALSLAAFSRPEGRVREDVLTHSGFQDFSKGSFEGGGTDIYVSAKGRIQLINRLDLNNDGKIEVLIANGHGHTEKEDLFIYPNRGGDFDQRFRIDLPVDGARADAVADLNRDGMNDIVIAHSDNGITNRLSAFIYYGSATGFSTAGQVELPAFSASAVACGDYNGDGWIDIAFACKNESAKGLTSTVYWNSPAGFDPNRKQDFCQDRLRGLAAGDGDGIADLLATGSRSFFLFRGGRSGLSLEQARPGTGTDIILADFNRDHRFECAVASGDTVKILMDRNERTAPVEIGELHQVSGIAAGDFDRDGFPDLAVAQSDISGNEFTDSVIIWNGPDGFDKRPRTSLPTVAASCVAAADLNSDGCPEVVFGNNHAYNDLSIPSLVYWNSRGGFYGGRKTMLDTRGAVGVAISDIDNDGKPDLIFANTEGGLLSGWNPNFVYWGDGTRNYSVARRTQLPGFYTTGTVQADLDHDGWVDVAFSEARYAIGRPGTLHGLYLYWGSKHGFPILRHSVLSANDAEGGLKTADLNHDGYLDLIAGGADNNGEGKGGFMVFWDGPNGHSAQRNQVFHTGGMCRAPLVADLNRDGYLDLAAAPYNVNGLFVFWGSRQGSDGSKFTLMDSDRNMSYPEAADLNGDGILYLIAPTRQFGKVTEADSFIYWGSKSGFSDQRRTALPSMAAYDPSVADLNGDGWLDIVMPNYTATHAGKRTVPTYIYWGGKDGFSPERRQELPADSGAGTLVADFDGDGRLDIFITCHRKDGSRDQAGMPHNHQTNSLIYWNGPGGFDTARRTELPSSGAHAQLVADPGNIMTRELAEYYISPPCRSAGQNALARRLDWVAETPFGSTVAFQVRSAATEAALPSAPWEGPEGVHSWCRPSGSTLRNIHGAWLQYRARLATPNGGPTPYLTRVSILFR